MSARADLPPVFVMNPYYNGLGIARSLRRRSVPVYALTAQRDAPGARSRCFDGVYAVPDGREEPQRLVDWLLAFREAREKRPVLFPTSDLDVLFLQRYRERLAPHSRLPQPGPDGPILRLMDKLELGSVARFPAASHPRPVGLA